MNNYYLNRLNMGRKVYACLDALDHTLLWKGKPPLALEEDFGILTNAATVGQRAIAKRFGVFADA